MHNNLIAAIQQGMAAHQMGNLPAAEAHYQRALAIDPGQFEALHFLGLLKAQTGDLAEADRLVARSLAVNGQRAEAHTNHARILRQLNRPQDAVARCDKALSLNPHLVDGHILRSNALRDLGRTTDALAAIDKALSLNPNDALALNNRGAILAELWRLDEALSSYDRALALRPDASVLLELLTNRGDLLSLTNRWEEALESYRQALSIKPDFAKVKLAACVAQLPVLNKDEAEVATRRAAYTQSLRALSAEAERGGLDEAADDIGRYQPFFLAYQGQNDRELQSLYGRMASRIVAKRYPPLPPPAAPTASQPLRVGIVSGYFWAHSVWKIPIKGWITQLDRRRFQIFGYHTASLTDAETLVASKLCHRFVQGPMSVAGWREAIAADAPHVLLYPDIGMDPMSAVLAAQRLAPVQCMSLGHPNTSGFPTIDYFLSSDLMEPADAQDHYTETLIRLPNISVYYEPLDTPPPSLTRADLGIRSDVPAFWCGQALFKYLPQFDEVFPRIAREIGNCQFAFIEYPKGRPVTECFARRLDQAFARYDLKASDYCVILPRLDQHAFVAAIGQCDIVLDSIGWSGFNSTIEGLAHDLPVVTMSGQFMRGRHSTAVLRMMGVTETISENLDDYVAAAVRLARDPQWYQAVKDRMAASKQRVYRDRACIAALEDFLDRVGRESVPTM